MVDIYCDTLLKNRAFLVAIKQLATTMIFVSSINKPANILQKQYFNSLWNKLKKLKIFVIKFNLCWQMGIHGHCM